MRTLANHSVFRVLLSKSGNDDESREIHPARNNMTGRGGFSKNNESEGTPVKVKTIISVSRAVVSADNSNAVRLVLAFVVNSYRKWKENLRENSGRTNRRSCVVRNLTRKMGSHIMQELVNEELILYNIFKTGR